MYVPVVVTSFTWANKGVTTSFFRLHTQASGGCGTAAVQLARASGMFRMLLDMANTEDKWHALFGGYGQHPKASGTLARSI